MIELFNEIRNENKNNINKKIIDLLTSFYNLNGKDIKEFINIIDYILILFNTIILDIYYIFRTLKYSYDNELILTKSIISISYFGNNHIKNIYNNFFNKFYDKVYIKINNSNIDDKCIIIEENINIDNIINELKEEYNKMDIDINEIIEKKMDIKENKMIEKKMDNKLNNIRNR